MPGIGQEKTVSPGVHYPGFRDRIASGATVRSRDLQPIVPLEIAKKAEMGIAMPGHDHRARLVRKGTGGQVSRPECQGSSVSPGEHDHIHA